MGYQPARPVATAPCHLRASSRGQPRASTATLDTGQRYGPHATYGQHHASDRAARFPS
jgi:hypothetical protein